MLTSIHKSINYSRKPESPETSRSSPGRADHHGQVGQHRVDHFQHLHTPNKHMSGGYHPSLDHLMMTTDNLLLGDFDAHHSSWHSSNIDTRGSKLESTITGTNFGILNWDTPTRLPSNASPSSPDISLASASLITSTNWQTKTTLGSDHLPILISLQMAPSSIPSLHRNYVNLKKENWERYSKEIEEQLSTRPLPTNCQMEEKILRAIILKAASRHIPSGRQTKPHLYQQRLWT